MMDNAAFRLEAAAGLFGWTPHPTQRLWLLDESRVKVASCGRRWGKTEAQAVDAATYAICNPGSRQMIVSPTYDQSRLISDTVERLLLNSPLTRPLTRCARTPYTRIEILGSMISARTADEDGRNLRGHSADRVIVDEAAYVGGQVIQEVIGPMLADRDGQLIMVSTPFGKNHFYRAFMRGVGANLVFAQGDHAQGVGANLVFAQGDHQDRPYHDGPGHPCPGPSDVASYRFPSWENPHISREYIERQKETMSRRQFSVEYEAEFVDDRNAVFSWTDIEEAIQRAPDMDVRGDHQPVFRDLSEAEIPKPTSSHWRVAGVDWARYSDYSAVVVIDTTQSPQSVVALDRFNGLPWRDQIERVVGFLQKHRVNAALTDQTSLGDPLLEMLREVSAKRGLYVDIQGLSFTNVNKREMVDNLAVAVAHKKLVIPNDETLIKELQYFEYEYTPAGHIRMNAKSGCTDDLVMALSLAAWAARGAPCDGLPRFLSIGDGASRNW